MTLPGAIALSLPVAFFLVSCANEPVSETDLPPASPPAVAAETIEAVPQTLPPGQVTRMPLGTLFHLQQSNGALIYDVRPTFFHRLGHIPGSINWPRAGFKSQLANRESEIVAAVSAGKPVVLYCTDLACPDAREVASALAARGHSLAVLEGGFDAWKAGELPLNH